MKITGMGFQTGSGFWFLMVSAQAAERLHLTGSMTGSSRRKRWKKPSFFDIIKSRFHVECVGHILFLRNHYFFKRITKMEEREIHRDSKICVYRERKGQDGRKASL